MARILVVDSDKWTTELLAAVLRIDAYDVRIAKSASDAFRTVITAEFQPELVIVNPALQPVSGIQLISSLVVRNGPIKTLWLCNSNTIANALRNSTGVSAVIQKPFTASDVRKAVRQKLKFQGPGEFAA